MKVLYGSETAEDETAQRQDREAMEVETAQGQDREAGEDGAVLHGMHPDMLKRAKLRCMHLLERKDYTERELRRKLEFGRTFYTPAEIDGAIAYVKGFHYVDDARYAARYIESMRSRKSRRQIEQDLLRRGVDREIAALAFDEAEEISEDTQIMEWIRKRHFDPATADPAERRKMYAFLARRGFDPESIARAMRQAEEENII